MSKANYPSVLLIYTGGTIGMIENQETGALEAFNFDQLITASTPTNLPLRLTLRIWSLRFGRNW